MYIMYIWRGVYCFYCLMLAFCLQMVHGIQRGVLVSHLYRSFGKRLKFFSQHF